ncbi:MAG: cupin domain-containing protein [Tatlockia sp.]|nr:cupin domain-containing protein [Tatlockia sp.]
MKTIVPILPQELVHELILKNDYFPNNSRFPLLIYRQVFNLTDTTSEMIQNFLQQNEWVNSWVDSIYDYHHYHSNTHEALVIISGRCKVQIGGDNGKKYDVFKGDSIIFPAGVSHKNVGSSSDFKCIGAYPEDIDYDLKYGLAKEHPQVDENIKKVDVPKNDPIFGKKGLLFDYWI